MDPRTQLVDVIRNVRNRWRLRLALRGAVVVVAGTVLALLLSASGLESFRFSAGAIIAFEATANGGSPDHSPRLVEKLVEQAIEQCRAVERGSILDRTASKRHSISLAAIAAITALIIAL